MCHNVRNTTESGLTFQVAVADQVRDMPPLITPRGHGSYINTS